MKSAIVTGAGQGIGFRFAQALGAQGYGLIVADIDGAEEVASRLRGTGISCHGVRADVSSEDEVARWPPLASIISEESMYWSTTPA
jgi:NAD(P)-dependent dehydrogenase (short-subunit alcohol dehydrogenase family)